MASNTLASASPYAGIPGVTGSSGNANTGSPFGALSGGSGGGSGLSGLLGALPGGIGSILSLLGSIGQSNQLGGLASSAGAGLNNVFGMLGPGAQSMMGAYNNSASPELQSLIGQLPGQYFGLTNQGLGYLGSAAGYGAGMAANPYLSGLASYSTAMAPGANPYLSQVGGGVNQLMNYSGLSPQQMSALQGQAGGAALSAANTMRSQSGGVANQGLLQKQLVSQAGQTGMSAATQLGAQGMADRLQALQSGTGMNLSAANQFLSQLTGGAGVSGEAGNMYLSGLQGAGGLLSGIGSQYLGAAGTALSGGLGASGQLLQGAGYGMGALQGMGNTYSNLWGLASSAQPQSPNLGGLGSLIGLLPGLFA
jgi:hypothetical protein